ncbi:MAG: rhodanese-like domain-containing protein [Candidatus Poseidoniaceae archaeon]|jgi:predicted sulfurtransferase|nr:rhodanese-like domain-containing protein [Candidatus Poseidoniaceae archaeon]
MWTNISAYKFFSMPDFEDLRNPLKEFCDSNGIFGTILLSPEGINIFLSAPRENIDLFVKHIREDVRFSDIWIKYSESNECAFRRMNVRLKKEIISMGDPSVKPHEFTGDSIEPKQFKRWLDEGKDITILDTRNDYEIRMGTFEGAVDFDIQTFRGFPDAVAQSEIPKDKPVVIFCTGGIRCEKASVVMLNQGFQEVYQINGGILNYFEETGGAHWNGECFVFDRRVGVKGDLSETDSEVCWACREPLTFEEVSSPDYIRGKCCPYCVEAKA